MATKRMLSSAVMPGAHGSPKPTASVDPAVIALLESGDTWEHVPVTPHDERTFVPIGELRDVYGGAEARIAACAPELLREVLRLEWREDEDGVGYCAHCAGDAPNHRNDCELDALLRKAGVR
jgi:hypothetical protein